MAATTTDEAPTGHALLLDVALRLFMEHGYDGVSMQDIATAANMTKGSPYYHFKGKEDLFLQAFRANVLWMNAQLLHNLESGTTLEDKLVSCLAALLRNSDPGMIRMMEDFLHRFQPQHIDFLSEDEMPPNVMRNAYRRVFEEEGVAMRVNPDVAAETLMMLQLGTLNMRLLQPGTQPLPLPEAEAEHIARQTIDLFLHGVMVEYET